MVGPIERSVAIERVEPADPVARAQRSAYVAELHQRLAHGFFEADADMVEEDDLVPPKGVLLLARVDGAPAGCGALKRLASDLGEIKHLYVSEKFRGLGVGRALLQQLEVEARGFGFSHVRLDTAAELHEAIALYRQSAYVEMEAYNDNPYAALWFEKDLASH